MTSSKIALSVWLDDQAEEAAAFYAANLPQASIGRKAHYPASGDNPSRKEPGSVLTVEATVAGQPLLLLNGGPLFKPNPSVSVFLFLPTSQEVDDAHAALSDGGFVMMPLDSYDWSDRYSWVQDRFGLTWQLMHDPAASRPSARLALLFAGPHDGRARAAVDAYVRAFPGSEVHDHGSSSADGAGRADSPVLFSLGGQRLSAMDGGTGHAFGFDEGVSLLVGCDDQAEIDRLATALSADGGEEGPCGWVRDRFGLWWQVTPQVLGDWLTGEDRGAADRVFEALMPMRRIDLAALERAYRGDA